ncbi:MAG: phosphatidylglycerophosphatase A [bacterium]|nr:MAG: phosphatidylglycerophosphatase A [bacterium]
MIHIFARVISTGLGAGYSPIAPGTVGAFMILIVYWISPEISCWQLLMIIFGLSALGIYTATITEKEVKANLGPDKGNDPGIIVIDEIIGMLIALIAIPKTTFFLIAAFILFRIFDILKPYPAQRFEKLPAGWGIVFDDVIAGIYTNLFIQVGRIIF